MKLVFIRPYSAASRASLDSLWRLIIHLLSPAPPAHDRSAIVARGVKTYEILGSPGFPTDRETLEQWVTRDAARAYYPAGVVRQMAAVMADGDRRARLRQ